MYGQKLYPGFESLPLRQFNSRGSVFPRKTDGNLSLVLLITSGKKLLGRHTQHSKQIRRSRRHAETLITAFHSPDGTRASISRLRRCARHVILSAAKNLHSVEGGKLQMLRAAQHDSCPWDSPSDADLILSEESAIAYFGKRSADVSLSKTVACCVAPSALL